MPCSWLRFATWVLTVDITFRWYWLPVAKHFWISKAWRLTVHDLCHADNGRVHTPVLPRKCLNAVLRDCPAAGSPNTEAPPESCSIVPARITIQVNIGLRVLTRPNPEKLPEIYRALGTDYAERVLPSIIQVSFAQSFIAHKMGTTR